MPDELPAERSRIEMIAFAAWVNVPVDKIPPSFRAPTCKHTMEAWKRVTDAIEADILERLRTPSEGMIKAGERAWMNRDLSDPDSHPIRDCFRAILTAFQQENK